MPQRCFECHRSLPQHDDPGVGDTYQCVCGHLFEQVTDKDKWHRSIFDDVDE